MMTARVGRELDQPTMEVAYDLAVGPVTGPLLSGRVLVLGLLAITAVVAGLAYLGPRRGVTPTFGPARNGVIAWAIDGDIHVGDPVSGVDRVLMSGPELDRNPMFSRDGTHVAFQRQLPGQTGRVDLIVARADGSAPALLSATPITAPRAIEWAPDGTSLFVNDANGRLVRYFVDGSQATVVADGLQFDADAFRPPDGAEILYERAAEPGALYAMHPDGSEPRELAGPLTPPCSCSLAGAARWSPDGQAIAFPVRVTGDQSRIFVMGADGSGLRQLTDEVGDWIEAYPAWSPSGDRIAFDRWQRDQAGAWRVRSIAVVSSAGGGIRSLGVAPASDGALIEWAPDGRGILSLPRTLVEAFAMSPDADGTVARPVLIDLDDGSSQEIDWSVGSISSWQRLAP